MLGKLYSKEIITLKEKKIIKAIPVESDRMECFLDDIITPSLIANVIIKFRGFVEVLMESGDSTLITMAAKLGTYVVNYFIIVKLKIILKMKQPVIDYVSFNVTTNAEVMAMTSQLNKDISIYLL